MADGPRSAIARGSGEGSCWACHWDFDENDPGGKVSLEGIPDAFVPGQRYSVTLSLSREGMVTAGFQMAVRFEDGSQAGTLEVGGDEERRVGISTDRDVQFAQHRLEGVPSPDASTRWTVTWTAPASGSGPAIFNVSALAGDGDESQVGDYVHTLERKVPAADR